MFKKRKTLHIALICFSLHANAGFWSDVGDATKSVVGYVYDVGAAIVSPVTNWLGRGNRGYSSRSHVHVVDNGYANGRFNDLEGSLSALSYRISVIDSAITGLRNEISRLNNRVNSLEKRTSNIERINKLQDLELELQAKIIEKNRITGQKNFVENSILIGAKDAFNTSKEAVKKFFGEHIKKLQEIKDPEVYDHYISVLSSISLSSLRELDKKKEDGTSVYPNYYKKDIISLADYYLEQIKKLPFSVADRSLLNKQIDLVQLAIFDTKESLYREASNDLKIVKKNKPSGKSQGDYVAKLLKDKGSQDLRRVLKSFEDELANSRVDNDSFFYGNLLISKAKALSFSPSEIESIEAFVKDSVYQSQNNTVNDNSSKEIANIQEQRSVFQKQTYQREVIEPCLYLLSKKYPDSLKKFFETQFQLTLYKVAWAYMDAVGEKSDDLNLSIDKLSEVIDSSGVTNILNEKGKKEYQTNLTLRDIVNYQQKKYKNDEKNRKYILNKTDQYSLSRANEVDESKYIKSLLEMIKHIYHDEGKTKYPTGNLVKKMDYLDRASKEYERSLTSSIGRIPSCQKLSSDISKCYLDNKNASFTDLITTVSSLQNTFLRKFENTSLPSLGDIEDKVSEIKSVREQKKSCAKKKVSFKESKTYILLYRDMGTTSYRSLIQPNDEIYLDYGTMSEDESIPVAKSNGEKLGWLKLSDVSESFSKGCLDLVNRVDYFEFAGK